jgi:hypothetical protein
MSYPQDPQGWQPPGSGGDPQQQPGGNDPQAQPPGYGDQQPGYAPQQPPGGYDPGGGYGDPYAQPGGYQPTYDPAGQPQYPVSGQPQYPVSGQPQYPVSGQPGSAPPTPGPYDYAQQPPSGYPGGYPGAPGAPPTAPPPPKKSRVGLIIGVAAAAVVLLCVLGSVGGYFVLKDDDPPKPTPTSALPPADSPPVSVSPTADPPLLAQFVDPKLRDFARNGAAKALDCSVVTKTIPANNNVSEAVKCNYTGEYVVYYATYKSLEDRDSYAESARKGFRDSSYIIDGDTFWSDVQSVRQGNYLTGSKKDTSTRFTYWDKIGVPISGEIYATTTSSTDTETFWKSIR